MEEKLSFREKVCYGCGEISCNFVFTIVTALLVTFYTDVVGISPAIIGTIIAISQVFNGASDICAGFIVDRTRSKHGRARVWELRMSIPYAVASVLLMTVPKAAPMAQAIYIFITYNLMLTVVYTMFQLPFATSLSYMTRSQTERAKANVVPELLASTPEIAEQCKKAGIPILGDDWKSQLGATIVNRGLMKLFEDRGVKVTKAYQLNYAGNTDFINLVMRGETKHVTKHDAITSILKDKDVPIAPGFAFVDNQGDQKTAIISIEGQKFGGAPVKLLLKLDVEDSPDAGGVMIDAIRCCKLAKDRGIAGSIDAPSSYFFKHPPVQYTDDECLELVNKFIAGEA